MITLLPYFPSFIAINRFLCSSLYARVCAMISMTLFLCKCCILSIYPDAFVLVVCPSRKTNRVFLILLLCGVWLVCFLRSVALVQIFFDRITTDKASDSDSLGLALIDRERQTNTQVEESKNGIGRKRKKKERRKETCLCARPMA
jgi:hypothetical protein